MATDASVMPSDTKFARRGGLLARLFRGGWPARWRPGATTNAAEGHRADDPAAARIAHDLNNVFAVIAAEVDAARETTTDPAIRAMTLTIAGAVRRGVALTRHIVADAGGAPLIPTVGDVNDALRAAMPRLREAAGRGGSLMVHMTERPLTVRVDHKGLTGCLEDLLLKARAACGGGAITLRTRLLCRGAAEADERLDAVIEVEVEDAAGGTAAEAPERKPRRATPAAARGLSNADWFARNSGGALDVRVLRGGGVRMALRLPLAAPEAALAPDASPRAGPIAYARGAARVLVVEDSDPLRVGTARRLRNAGLAVAEAADADSARSIIAAGIDALVTDVVLAGSTDGFGLARFARSLNPATALVFMSGFISARQPELLASDDLANFMRKPIDFDNLIAVLRGLLAARGDPCHRPSPAADTGAKAAGTRPPRDERVSLGTTAVGSPTRPEGDKPEAGRLAAGG